MNRQQTIGPTVLLATALYLMPAVPALADTSVLVTGGFRSSPTPHYAPRRFGSPGQSPKYGHRGQRPQYSHGVPFISRRYDHRPRVYGQPGRHVISPGCGPVTRRSYDRHGRLVVRHLSLCYDRYGRSYVLGGGGRRRHR